MQQVGFMRKAWSIAERRQWWTHFFSGVRVVSDALAVNASIALAYWIRFGSGWFPAPKGVPPVENYLAAMFAVTAVWLLTFRACEMYREQVRPSLPDEFYRVTVAATLATLVLMALTFLYRGFEYSRLTAFFAWGLSIVLTTAGRWTVDALAQSLKRRGVWRTRLALLASPEIVERFQGFDEAQEVVAALSLTSAAPVVERKAHLEQLLQLVNAGQIDQVIVSRALVSTDELLRLLAGCEQRGITLALIPDTFDLILRRGVPVELGGLTVLRVRQAPLSGWNAVVKRVFDVVVSLTALLVLSPLMLLIALLIRLTSKGPAIYRQKRVGLNGQVFTLYKFRTMQVDAEAETGPVWAQSNDPRCTPLGRFLRRTSLDELPQLVNVLKGEMSLVGPRPERPYFVEKFQQQIPRYMERHRVKAGLTGWAQVSGQRGGESEIEERTRHDIYYIENWSLLFDLHILLKTLFEVLFHRGAR